MKVIYNNIIPTKKRKRINLFGILFVRYGNEQSEEILNHEKIHTREIWETGGIGFYMWYGIEWIVRMFQKGFNRDAAYHAISFEREAFENQDNSDYLSTRKPYAWVKYLRRAA